MSVDTRTPRPGFDDQPALSMVKVNSDPAQVIVNHASFRVQLAPVRKPRFSDPARVPALSGAVPGRRPAAARRVDRKVPRPATPGRDRTPSRPYGTPRPSTRSPGPRAPPRGMPERRRSSRASPSPTTTPAPPRSSAAPATARHRVPAAAAHAARGGRVRRPARRAGPARRRRTPVRRPVRRARRPGRPAARLLPGAPHEPRRRPAAAARLPRLHLGLRRHGQALRPRLLRRRRARLHGQLAELAAPLAARRAAAGLRPRPPRGRRAQRGLRPGRRRCPHRPRPLAAGRRRVRRAAVGRAAADGQLAGRARVRRARHHLPGRLVPADHRRSTRLLRRRPPGRARRGGPSAARRAVGAAPPVLRRATRRSPPWRGLTLLDRPGAGGAVRSTQT